MGLKDENPEIARMKDEKDLDGLFKKVELEGYDNHKIREQAIRALGEIKDPSAIKPLIRRLKKGGTPSKYIKRALLGMGEEAVSPLIDLLGDEKQVVRLRVINILGGTRNTKAVEALIQMLNVDDGWVRREAVISLGVIGDMRAIDSLIPMLEDKFDYVHKEADKSLYRLGWQPEGSPPIPDIKTLVANSDVEGLIKATAFEKDILIRIAAADALGEFSDPRAIAPLISLLKEDWPGAPYMNAVNSLAKIGSPAVEPLIQLLQDGNQNIRAGTANALGKIGDTKAIDALISNLWDNIPFVRWSAADALGAIGDPAVPRLIDVLDRLGRHAPMATARALKKVAGQDFKDDAAAWKRWWEEYRQSESI